MVECNYWRDLGSPDADREKATMTNGAGEGGKPSTTFAALYILINSLKMEHRVDEMASGEFLDDQSDDNANEGLRGA